MKRFGWLFCAVALLGLPACGDDDGGDPVTGGDMAVVDMPPARTPVCPSGAPSADELTLPCCYRVSNADRLDAPEFRVTNLKITQPTSLANSTVLGILAAAVENEQFNWLMSADVDGTDVTIRTGYGSYDEGTGTYSFAMGEAPAAGGPTDRWDPVVIEGTLDGETFTAPPVAGSFAVPVFNEANPELIDLELPLNNFTVLDATFSEDRTCIGTRTGTSPSRAQPSNYESGGQVRTYITVEDARAGYVTALSKSLCDLVSQSACVCAPDATDCVEVAEVDFEIPLDAVCDAGGSCEACTPGSGDCNAWTILGSFAAAGVEIQ